MKQFVFHFDKDGYHITVKLPRSYYQACDSRYPALIVHDGDNLFKKLKVRLFLSESNHLSVHTTLHPGQPK